MAKTEPTRDQPEAPSKACGCKSWCACKKFRRPNRTVQIDLDAYYVSEQDEKR